MTVSVSHSRAVKVTAHDESATHVTVALATGPPGPAPWVALTEAEFLETERQPDTLYLITDKTGP